MSNEIQYPIVVPDSHGTAMFHKAPPPLEECHTLDEINRWLQHEQAVAYATYRRQLREAQDRFMERIIELAKKEKNQ